MAQETVYPDTFRIKPTREERQAAKHLQSLINPLDWGEEEEYYGVPRANTSNVIEAVLSKQSKRYLKRLSQKTIFYHSQKYRTIFFAGNHKQVTLQMVDIDCHNRGTHEGALEMHSFLTKHYFPGMYFETSRGGVGINGYVIIDKQALSNQSYNKLTKELEKRLKEVAAKEGFDISDIEIKGSCPIITWKDHVPHYKAGTLARLPRDIVAFHQQGTTTLTARELIDLVVTPVSDYIPQPQAQKVSGSKGGQCIDPEPIAKYLPFADKLLQGFINEKEQGTFKGETSSTIQNDGRYDTTTACSPVWNKRNEKGPTGTGIDKNIPDGRPNLHKPMVSEYCIITLSRIKNKYADIGQYQHTCAPIIVSNQTAITAKDIAITLAIGAFFKKHPNPDGSSPTARWKALWDSLYQAGDIDRAWDNKRFAFIRNLLTNCGFIEWIDASYSLGRACKWAFTEELMDILSELTEETTVSSNTSNICGSLCGKQNIGIKPDAPFFGVRPVYQYEQPFNWGDYEHRVGANLQQRSGIRGDAGQG